MDAKGYTMSEQSRLFLRQIMLPGGFRVAMMAAVDDQIGNWRAQLESCRVEEVEKVRAHIVGLRTFFNALERTAGVDIKDEEGPQA